MTARELGAGDTQLRVGLMQGELGADCEQS